MGAGDAIEFTSLDPRVRQLWRRQGLFGVVPLGVVAAGMTLAAALTDGPVLALAGVGVVIVGTAVALLQWLPDRIYSHWSYRLGDVALEVRHGAFIRRRSVIPYFRVQHVDTATGPIERSLGLAQLTIHTASSGTDKKIPGLDESTAATVRAHIISRAGLSDGV